ncbi:hypothetical protein RCOM_1184880 [Ricinus communis]|uniref:Acyltransferase n=1 Tax=Ricinus communis TaxID=3988 RepID=B9SPM9_RICCO|nr:hypothetical protein RCOM_1184880 [Ricinus communis]
MEGEIQNFIWVWITVFISLCYCYAIGKFISKGTKRLLFILPVVCFFLYLPLNLFSPHLGGTTAFFIAWLANFKLLLFAFGKGPLSSDPSISLPLFTAVSCLPIKIQKENPSPKSYQNGHNPQNSSNPSQNSQIREDPSPRKLRDSFLNYAIKALMHELMFYYLGRTTPTGDISVFFLLHGFCLTAEIAFKKWLNGRWQLPGLVSGILTVGFVMSTGFWLFFPNFMHSQIDVRAFEDYATVVAFLKNTSENVMRF